MPEFKVVGGTVSDAIHFFEQAFHITFPVQAPSGGSIGNSPGASAGPAAAGQDLAHVTQEHLPQGAADSNPFGSFGPDIHQALVDFLTDPHRHAPDFADFMNGLFHGIHWSDIA